MKTRKIDSAFTLIELLIVVAIIGILASIAVPNFLSALTRARVARVEEESRVIFVALEAYRLERNTFPPPLDNDYEIYDFRARLRNLTTPVSYLTAVPADPFPHSYDNGAGFIDLKDIDGANAYCYGRADYAGPRGTLALGDKFAMIASSGPDGILNQIHYFPPAVTHTGGSDCPVCAPALSNLLTVTLYNPSNGILSNGDLYRWSTKTSSFR
ncbi:MAG: type II secretion system protein [Candidatus Omnitrophota bacterium]|jgi:prepilin-type N-terminal cleavage/methylation domain-containing protein|nr:MAG: type II secretion system protein [Candidatus Omnitrophota bacterium]